MKTAQPDPDFHSTFKDLRLTLKSRRRTTTSIGLCKQALSKLRPQKLIGLKASLNTIFYERSVRHETRLLHSDYHEHVTFC